VAPPRYKKSQTADNFSSKNYQPFTKVLAWRSHARKKDKRLMIFRRKIISRLLKFWRGEATLEKRQTADDFSKKNHQPFTKVLAWRSHARKKPNS